MRLLVKPGAQFPWRRKRHGRTASDESNLPGDATPVEKTGGDLVLSGTMNLWGAVEARVLRPVSESSLQKIIRLIREAQHQKAPSQQFTDRFSTAYTYLVLGLSLVMFFVWWLGFGQPPFKTEGAGHSAFYHTLPLLVVASPCALVLSIPSAVLAAIAWGARHGILFRGGAAVEKLAAVTAVALDKTGTLTTGELRVEKVETFPPGREAELARLAYSMEKLSTHPLARAITRYGKQQQLPELELTQFESLTGQGLRARHQGVDCLLGRRDWLLEMGAFPQIQHVPPLDSGFSEVWVARGDLLGRLVLRDDIRPQARQVVEALRHEQLTTVVLTGDRQGRPATSRPSWALMTSAPNSSPTRSSKSFVPSPTRATASPWSATASMTPQALSPPTSASPWAPAARMPRSSRPMSCSCTTASKTSWPPSASASAPAASSARTWSSPSEPWRSSSLSPCWAAFP
jgi:Cd2+/Zn2+-exporting ATPase